MRYSMKSRKSKIMKQLKKDRFIISVKVGAKGQIVIPRIARTMFNIKSGDTLMVLGDKKRGIALMKDEAFYQVAGFDYD